MPSPPFPPRPVPRKDNGSRVRPRTPPNTPVRPHPPPNDAPQTLRSILRPTPPSFISTPHEAAGDSQVSHPQPPPPIPRSTTTSSYHHHHTSSSPELLPREDSAWPLRVRPSVQQLSSDPLRTRNAPNHIRPSSYIVPRPRADQHDTGQRRSGLTTRVSPHFVPGVRGRSTSDVRTASTQPLDLDPDRLARACGQPAPTSIYQNDDRGWQVIDSMSSRAKDPGTMRTPDILSSCPPLPKVRVGHLYRRLDALARRSGHRAMDYVSFEDIAVIHKQDNQFRAQLRRQRSGLLEEKDPNFHAIGTPLEDVLLYASTNIVIGGYRYHLPTVVVACVEELTKTGIYQSGLFRALPSRDRHLQLIDLFDKSPDFGAHFNMRGQAMPDICALLSTFISSLPTPLLDSQIYSALWHWSIKPTVKREDARRDRQEEEDEERRARGEPPYPNPWMMHDDLYVDGSDSGLETDQISIAQILLRFLPSTNLSLLAYLCSFFTQLPLCPENGLQLEDVARIFGPRLLGGSVKSVSQRMMNWLLTRWPRISETLFEETCGMSAPTSPSCTTQLRGSAVASEGAHERTEKRQGSRGSVSDGHTTSTSTSSSRSFPSVESPEDYDGLSRRPSWDGEERGRSSGESRHRKKRELDAQDSNGNIPLTRQESRHAHQRTRRGSGSHSHHAHSSEQKDTSPDPFAMAFSKVQHGASDPPPPVSPMSLPSAAARGEGDETRELRSESKTRISRFESGSRRTNLDICVVDALIQETAVTTDAAKALAERVEALERTLQVRCDEEVRINHPIVCHPAVEEQSKGKREGEHSEVSASQGTEDLRLQLRLVEAERDKAQQIVRDVRAYLLDTGSSVIMHQA